jgi:xylan 1,4-beta-xylosidase
VAKDGKFALRDLRVFGNGQGAPPAAVVNLTVKRGDDARNITFSWTPSPHADGYVIHYGVAPDALHLNLQYQGGSMNHLTVSCLNREVKYFYRIDAYDDSGITTGSETTAAQ